MINIKNFEKAWAVILAGGNGTRFWPKSLERRPKQLAILGTNKKTMLEITLDRLDSIIPKERRIIVTNEAQMELTKKIAAESCHHFIPEPVGRNTAAALAIAALEIKYLTNSDNDIVMLSFHADHIIKDCDLFLKSLEESVSVAKENYLTLIGIKPNTPDTGFGYIKAGSQINKENCLNSYEVRHFFEKPKKEVAEAYLKEGSYFWNSGLFVWKNNVFLSEIENKLSDTFIKLTHFYEKNRNEKNCFSQKNFLELYKTLENISVDHAIFEKSNKIAMTTTNMNWMDVGSWDALAKAFPRDKNGNVTSGDYFLFETKNCVIDAGDKFVATLGLENLIVVTVDNSILVCHKDKAQEVKRVVEFLKENDKTKFL